LGLQQLQCAKIAAKGIVLLRAVLKAGEVRTERASWLFNQVVDPPIPFAANLHESVRLEVTEVLGDLHLALTEDLLQVTDTEGTPAEQMENPEARPIAQAFVNLNQFHRGNLYSSESICRKRNLVTIG